MVNTGDLVVVNATFTDNHVTGFGPGDGGAVLVFGPTTVVSSTIAGDSAANGAGGIAGFGVGMANSILAQNTASPSPDCGSGLESQGYNILGDPTGCTVTAAAGDQVGTGASPLDPLLGPLAGNGGPTPTLALTAPRAGRGQPDHADRRPRPHRPISSRARRPTSAASRGRAAPAATSAPSRSSCRHRRPRCHRRRARCHRHRPRSHRPRRPPVAPPFVAPPIDTFKCYGAGETGFVRRAVQVRDQFATRGRTTRLRQTTLVCNPAAKDARGDPRAEGAPRLLPVARRRAVHAAPGERHEPVRHACAAGGQAGVAVRAIAETRRRPGTGHVTRSAAAPRSLPVQPCGRPQADGQDRDARRSVRDLADAHRQRRASVQPGEQERRRGAQASRPPRLLLDPRRGRLEGAGGNRAQPIPASRGCASARHGRWRVLLLKSDLGTARAASRRAANAWLAQR